MTVEEITVVVDALMLSVWHVLNPDVLALLVDGADLLPPRMRALPIVSVGLAIILCDYFVRSRRQTKQ
jgi:hypothetical protein